ncbi:MAG: hypothetical protein AB1758_17250, partial [Candidatus Eremiobacterota bacterium]
MGNPFAVDFPQPWRTEETRVGERTRPDEVLTRRQIIALLVAAWLFMGLDLSWRAATLFSSLSPAMLAANGLLTLLPCLAALLAAGLLLRGLELALKREVVLLGVFLLTVYVNLLYLKLFLCLTFKTAQPLHAGIGAAVLGAALAAGWFRGLGTRYTAWLDDVGGAVLPATLAVLAIGGSLGLAGYLGLPARFGSGHLASRKPHVLLLTADSLSSRH